MNEYTLPELSVGLTESFSREITAEMEDAFRAVSGDVNPLHRDDDFARAAGGGRFSGHVAFGMLTASLYSALAGVYLPGKHSLIHSFDELSFLKPVYAGDTLTVTGTVAEKWDELGMIRVKAKIKNQNGKTVSRANIKIMVLQ